MSVKNKPYAAYIIAETDEEGFIGVSNLTAGVDNTLHTGFTGVKRSWRRKGVATALKARAIAFARDYHTETILADNEENNPMYLLNLQLGFEPTWVWCNYIQTFERM